MKNNLQPLRRFYCKPTFGEQSIRPLNSIDSSFIFLTGHKSILLCSFSPLENILPLFFLWLDHKKKIRPNTYKINEKSKTVCTLFVLNCVVTTQKKCGQLIAHSNCAAHSSHTASVWSTQKMCGQPDNRQPMFKLFPREKLPIQYLSQPAYFQPKTL